MFTGHVYYSILVFRTWVNRKQYFTRFSNYPKAITDIHASGIQTKVEYSGTFCSGTNWSTCFSSPPALLDNTSFPKQWLWILTESYEWYNRFHSMFTTPISWQLGKQKPSESEMRWTNQTPGRNDAWVTSTLLMALSSYTQRRLFRAPGCSQPLGCNIITSAWQSLPGTNL